LQYAEKAVHEVERNPARFRSRIRDSNFHSDNRLAYGIRLDGCTSAWHLEEAEKYVKDCMDGDAGRRDPATTWPVYEKLAKGGRRGAPIGLIYRQ